jgi:TRAP-type C4-dicarboxylate transport system permease small subunit
VEQNGRPDAESESPGTLKRLQVIAGAISRGGAMVGGALLLAAAVTICVDISLRYAFALTIGGADDLAGYALAIASAWGFSAALLSRSHIRIDTVYVRVKRRAVRAALDLLSVACFSVFAALLAWHGWGVLQLSYISGSRSQSAIEMPLAIPQAVWFAGLAFFLAVALLLLAGALHACLKRDLDSVFRLIGSKSAVAEAKEEITAIERALEAEQRK